MNFPSSHVFPYDHIYPRFQKRLLKVGIFLYL